MEVLNECSRHDCEDDEVGTTGLCNRHLDHILKQGWKLNHRTGTMTKGTTKVTKQGKVTVGANYNPRMMALMTEEISVEELDEEELARGMCRNPDGSWPAKIPDMVPKTLHDRMVRELFSRADEALRVNLLNAVNSVTKIATGEHVEPQVKLKAATWMFERLRGKVPDVVQVTQEKPFEVTLQKLHRGPRPTDDDVVDAEVVEADTGQGEEAAREASEQGTPERPKRKALKRGRRSAQPPDEVT